MQFGKHYDVTFQLGEELEFHMIQSVQNPDIMDDKYGGEMSPLTASWHAMQVKVRLTL